MANSFVHLTSLRTEKTFCMDKLIMKCDIEAMEGSSKWSFHSWKRNSTNLICALKYLFSTMDGICQHCKWV
jgi:hypothetical protein